ncbi:histidine kinase [Flavobacterium jejuense]|uniref:histidine kinase n=1 Tax=Flavobacterium jejuense TaxID=1544455 RepID=A0ABX0IS33_9FLAO|nr:ATP-binding protein [Flavobacterium jejuense]NHN25900.1 histidine kinase [Flavobacterium jejuense]
MASKNFYYLFILHIFFLIITALTLAFFFLNDNSFFGTFFLIILILQSFLLLRFINQTNRKIAYFFESIKNEDFSMSFSEDTNVSSLNELHKSLNMLNDMIQNVHLKKQTQEKYYQEIIKQANIGILTYNKKGHILFANPKIEELLNHKPLNHIKQIEKIDAKMYHLFSELDPFDRKLIQLTNEREKKLISLKSTSITLNNEELLLVVAQDIYQELDEKESDSWARLIRVLTHEIMNAISPITSISESILKYYQKTDSSLSVEQIQNTIKGLGIIKEQGNDLMEFVQSYRRLLSLPPPDKAFVPAIRLLEKIKVLMNKECTDTNIHFTEKINPPDLEFFIDEKQISQILINLTKNALQSIAGLENGSIIIIAGITDQGNRYIEVCDNGPGVPSELIDEVFVPFFTTKTSGTGIGLSLSKQIMHLHGGSIKAYSVPFQKTSFILTF